jgi:hypothetical protein
MEISQYRRSYKVFKDEVTFLFESVRKLSNGDLIGKSYEEIENSLTLEEVRIHIGYCHKEPELEK